MENGKSNRTESDLCKKLRTMAQVIEIMTNSGAEMMLRGKLGNQVFQVRNGKQIVTRIPRRRTSKPTEQEIAKRLRFAEIQAILAALDTRTMGAIQQSVES